MTKMFDNLAISRGLGPMVIFREGWCQNQKRSRPGEDEGRNSNSPRSECSVQNVPHVHDVEAAQMPFSMCDDTRPSHVASASDHDHVTRLKLDMPDDFVLHKVKFHCVVDFDGWVRVSDGAAVVSDDVGDALAAELVFADLAELEVGLLR